MKRVSLLIILVSGVALASTVMPKDLNCNGLSEHSNQSTSLVEVDLAQALVGRSDYKLQVFEHKSEVQVEDLLTVDGLACQFAETASYFADATPAGYLFECRDSIGSKISMNLVTTVKGQYFQLMHDGKIITNLSANAKHCSK